MTDDYAGITIGTESETFSERVDVSTTPDGTSLGSFEVTSVTAGSEVTNAIEALAAENRALRDQVTDLEEQLAAAPSE